MLPCCRRTCSTATAAPSSSVAHRHNSISCYFWVRNECSDWQTEHSFFHSKIIDHRKHVNINCINEHSFIGRCFSYHFFPVILIHRSIRSIAARCLVLRHAYTRAFSALILLFICNRVREEREREASHSRCPCQQIARLFDFQRNV